MTIGLAYASGKRLSSSLLLSRLCQNLSTSHSTTISRVGEARKLLFSTSKMSLTLERFIMKVQEPVIKRLASALHRRIVTQRATKEALREVQRLFLRNKVVEAANQ